MALWLLRPVEGHEMWGAPYDKMHGVVVRSKDEASARRMASGAAMDEGRSVWLDDTVTTCEKLAASGASCIVIRDVLAG